METKMEKFGEWETENALNFGVASEICVLLSSMKQKMLSQMAASDELKTFQAEFDDIIRRVDNCFDLAGLLGSYAMIDEIFKER